MTSEEFEKIDAFYDFLQGKSMPEGFVLTHKPKLTAQKAFTVIYVLQEFLHLIPDNIESCDKCHELFDADKEGFTLDDQYDLNGKTLPKKYWGHYCNFCAPPVDFELR